MRQGWRRGTVTIGALAVALGACGGDGNPGGNPGPATSAAPVAAEAPPRAAACAPVSAELLATIAEGVNVPGAVLRDGFAVRSGAHREMAFVSAEIDGQGYEGTGDVETWLVSALEPTAPGLTVLAVSSRAVAVSDWPDAAKTDAGATMADPGATESAACARRGG